MTIGGHMFYVYAYLRKSDNTPYYIGKGKDNRISAKHHINVPKDKSHIVFLETNLTEIGAFALERRYIRWYGRKDLGTGILRNRTDGGEGSSGRIVSNEEKEHMSKIMAGRPGTRLGKKNTEEHNKKISIANTGKISPLTGISRSPEVVEKIAKSNTGKKRSEETKKKLSESHKGKTQSEDSNKKRSVALKGRKISEDQKQLLSRSRQGENNPMFGKESPMKGKSHSEETKNKIREARSKQITTEETKRKMSESQKQRHLLKRKLNEPETICNDDGTSL